MSPGVLPFHDKALRPFVGFISQVLVSVFLDFLRSDILVGELNAHEGARLVRGGDALDTLRGGGCATQ